MQALVFNGPGQKRLEDRPKPTANVMALTQGAAQLITHRFRLGDILDAYDTFAKAAETQALKVIIDAA